MPLCEVALTACLYVYVCVYLCVPWCVGLFVYMYICVCMCLCFCIYVCVYVCVCAYTSLTACMCHSHVNIFEYICTHIRTSVFT